MSVSQHTRQVPATGIRALIFDPYRHFGKRACKYFALSEPPRRHCSSVTELLVTLWLLQKTDERNDSLVAPGHPIESVCGISSSSFAFFRVARWQLVVAARWGSSPGLWLGKWSFTSPCFKGFSSFNNYVGSTQFEWPKARKCLVQQALKVVKLLTVALLDSSPSLKWKIHK